MNKVRKLLPLSLYDIPGIEQWLEAQANAGLFPLRVAEWATFVPTGVPGTRFRLEPYSNEVNGPSDERRELYRSFGWEYAMSVGGVYHLFYATDPDTPELYSDYHSRGLSLERLEKKAKRSRMWTRIFWVVFLAVIVFFLFFFQSRFDAQPDNLVRLPMILVNLAAPEALFLIMTFYFMRRRERHDLRTIQATVAALKEGQAPPPSPGPQKAFAWENIAWYVLVWLMCITSLVQNVKDLDRFSTIPLNEFDQPYIAIQQIEQEEVFYWDELFETPPHNGESFAEQHFSFLAPTWYEVEQKAYSPFDGTTSRGFSPDKSSGKYRYSPSLDMTRLKLLIPALARPVARAIMDEYCLVNLRWIYDEMAVEGLDFCIIARVDGEKVWQMAALGHGGSIAVFLYAGAEDIADHLDTLATMVS